MANRREDQASDWSFDNIENLRLIVIPDGENVGSRRARGASVDRESDGRLQRRPDKRDVL